MKTISNKMIWHLTAIVTYIFIKNVNCGEISACDAWSKIEDQLNLEKEQLSCVKNIACTGINCSGSFEGEEFHAGLEMHNCEIPSFVKIIINIPQLGIHDWQRSFTNGSTFYLTDSIKGEISILKETDKFVVNMSIKAEDNIKKYFPKLLSSSLIFPIFKGIAFPASLCNSPQHKNKHSLSTVSLPLASNFLSDAKQNGNCSVSNSSCDKEETCLQLDKLQVAGICVCRPFYSRDATGKCVYTPESSTTASVPVPESQTGHQSGPSASVVRTAVLVSVTSILLLVTAIYVIVKFRVFQYIRRKLRVQVYEHVLLGQQEDNDESLTDPVA